MNLTKKLKAPFSPGSVKSSCKCSDFSLKASSKGENIGCTLRSSSDDLLKGVLQPSFSVPSSYSFDGRTFQLDVKKDINGFLKLNHVVSFVPETSKFGNATRLELISSYLRGSANIDYSAPREAKINLKGIYGDASAQLNGKLFQPRNLKYTLNPTKNVSLETDFNKFKIGLIQAGETAEGGIEYGWSKGNSSHSLVLAVKKRLPKADLYAKVDHNGEVSFAQTAFLDLGTLEKIKCTIGCQFNALQWQAPRFGVNFDLNF
ncbi:Oidioi.mRNA.OKI2018_I69.PAR.g11506.t1.cds [Oikopleura dioica]|uniref:Oidioi.mRNA.OKI2018_I69.PAR.g11506.t1.cds n=1 Tax=Oikopleura dioica TaxID=34765 RepID=A0ABN7S377_OIKDI|nr:Oidioi.mRNA.OKI2018_I69.PAR.g11506.t1.cds [Oikopleura dioica]